MNMFDRDLGRYPISIGTSLAIETIAGINKDKPVKGIPPIRQYETMLISIRMLMRNIYSSITDRRVAEDLPEQDFYDALIMEMRYLKEAILSHNPNMKIVYYATTYNKIAVKFPMARIKMQRSMSTMKYADLEVSALKAIFKNEAVPAKRMDYLEKIEVSLRTLVWTNSPIDLITLNKPLVSLLESHTGNIKDRSQWHTKFTGDKDFSRIPFNKAHIQVMGDGGYLLSPIVRYKNRLLRIAEENKWNTTTPMSKVLADVSKSGEKELLEYLDKARK